MSRLRDHCPRVDPAYSLMPRGGSRNGVPKFMKPHTQRLNISNVGQSASFQSNYLSTFPDACQYLKALLKLRISRFAFSGSRACEEARPLPRTIQSEQQRAEAEQLCGFLPPRSCRASRRAPPHRVPERATRAGAAAAKLGCENGLRRAKKRFSVSRRAQSTEGRPRRRQRQPRQ